MACGCASPSGCSRPRIRRALEMTYADVAAGKGQLAWCDALAVRVRTLAGGFGAPRPATRHTA